MMNTVHNVPSAPADADAAGALDGLLELATRLAEIAQQGMTDRGLTRARAALMLQLYRHGPAVQRRISQALGVTPRHVTGLVDALEADGWVSRGPHPTDRRATVVTLTEQGHAAVARMDDERRAWAKQLFGDLPAEDLAAFMTVVRRVNETIPRDESDPRCPE